MKIASPNPYDLTNITHRNTDPYRALRREQLVSIVRSGGTQNLTFPSPGLGLVNRDLDSAGVEFMNVRLLADELRPHSNLLRAGATMIDLGSSPTGTQLPSISPELSGTWQGAAPSLDPECRINFLLPQRLSARIVLSNQLMRMTDDMLLSSFVERQLYSAIASAIEKAALTGSGTNEPCGILADANHETIDAAVAPAAINSAERKIAEAYLENDIRVITSPLVRESLRSTVLAETLWGTDLPKHVSPHLTTAGNTEGHIAIVGSFPDFIIATWGGIDLLADPYSRDTEGFFSVRAEVFADCISMRPGSFKIINPT